MLICMTISSPDGPGLAVLRAAEGAEVGGFIPRVYLKVNSPRGKQMAAALGGGMVKQEWFKTYTGNNLPKEFELMFQSWDTANKHTELADSSVCTTWGLKEKHLFVLHGLRKQLDYPALNQAVLEQARVSAATNCH